jgi:hypothetical protein
MAARSARRSIAAQEGTVVISSVKASAHHRYEAIDLFRVEAAARRRVADRLEIGRGGAERGKAHRARQSRDPVSAVAQRPNRGVGIGSRRWTSPDNTSHFAEKSAMNRWRASRSASSGSSGSTLGRGSSVTTR